jgi:hypothetical protein
LLAFGRLQVERYPFSVDEHGAANGGDFYESFLVLGELETRVFKYLAKSLSLGKSTWQVAHDVPYCRANTGMAFADGTTHRKMTLEEHSAIYDLSKAVSFFC